ncbi:MAG: hypothetical protein IJA85_08575 [Clostridia bacterium]|nr:hypothetical protein [Clostridia bacterium]
MHKTVTKILTLLLVCVTVITPLTSCSEDAANKTTENTVSGDTQPPQKIDPLAERKSIDDRLPEKNLDGYELRVHARDNEIDTIFAEEEVGEPVNDALVRMHRSVDERFNAAMKIYNSELGDHDQVNEIKKLVTSGDGTYNLAAGHDVLLSVLTLENYFVNIYNLPYQNFNQPWWSGVDDLTFMGQCYLITSDMSYQGIKGAKVLFINKDIMEDYGIEMPYQQVFDGKWTLDSLIAISKDIYEDLNGNNEADEEDLYGLLTEPEMYGYLDSFDLDTLVRDGDTLHVNFDLNKFNNIVTKMYQYLCESKGAKTTGVGNDFGMEEFMNRKTMIFHENVGVAVNHLRFVENLDYGILPMPKWDEKQETYKTAGTFYPFVIPSSLDESEYENTSLLLEAYSAESYKQVLPAYFEIALKQKYTTDNESMRVLDIVKEAQFVSFAYAYEYGQGFNICMNNIFNTGGPNGASYYEKNVKRAAKQAEKVQKAFEKMAEEQGL